MWSVQNGRYVDKNPAEQKVWRGFGWEGRPLSDRELVRPSGFEPPTFCSGGKESMCILLTYMAAMTCLKANRRRIQAAVDERLMKGFRETSSQNHFFDSLSRAGRPRLSRERNPGAVPIRCPLGQRRHHSPLTANNPPRTSPAVREKHSRNLGGGAGWATNLSGQQFSEFQLLDTTSRCPWYSNSVGCEAYSSSGPPLHERRNSPSAAWTWAQILGIFCGGHGSCSLIPLRRRASHPPDPCGGRHCLVRRPGAREPRPGRPYRKQGHRGVH